MKKIKVIQVGLGPLGQKVAKYIKQREGIELVGAVDINPELNGKPLSEITGIDSHSFPIKPSIASVLEDVSADAVILTTVSGMKQISKQIEEIVRFSIPVVSTCEELVHPWNTHPELSRSLDDIAKKNGVAVLGTGVNPGFLMDALPSFMGAVCQKVDKIEVVRKQDATTRRVPFQKKIGAGLSCEEFNELVANKKLGHVGLAESLYLAAQAMNWSLDAVEDIISPIIVTRDIECGELSIKEGGVAGIQQIARGSINGQEKINLLFRASIGEASPEDSVKIVGDPGFKIAIEGGLNGDVATCAIAINAVKQIIFAEPGLRTMADSLPATFLR